MSIAAHLPALPKWMFWLPIIIAYVTPFYMMRVWWLTFCGKPRDHHVHDHAHENWKMYFPLVILAIGTVFCSYKTFRPMIHDAAAVATDSSAIVAIDGEAHEVAEAGRGAMLTLNHAEGKNPHDALAKLVGFAWIIGMGFAVLIYRGGLALAKQLKRLTGPIATALDNKLYFDHVYDGVLVGGTLLVGQIAGLFDKIVVDGLVNLTGMLTRFLGSFTGRQLDMPVHRGDVGLVDAVANGLAQGMLDMASAIRRPQSGRIRMYVMIATGTAAAALLVVLFYDDIGTAIGWLTRRSTAMAQQ